MSFLATWSLRSFSRRQKIKLVLLLCLLIALAFAARPGYRQLKTWRAHWFATQAETLLKEERQVEALQKAASAYQLSPYHPRVILLMARVYAPINPNLALNFWLQLEQQKALTDDTRHEFIRYCLSIRRFDLAQQQLNPLLQAPQPGEATLLLAAEMAALRGDREAAERHCQRILQLNPTQRKARFILAGLHFRSQDPQQLARGKQLLEALLDLNDEFSLQALIQLSRWPGLSPQELEKIRHQLRAHPQASEQDRLYADSLRIQIEPANRSRILQEVRELYASQPPPQRLEAARWFNQQRESAQVLQLLSLQEALQRQDLFLVWADAMALTRRWKELEQVLERENVPLERLVVSIFRARAVREQGDTERANILWNRALLESSNRPEILWYMAAYAEKLRAYDLAAATYRQLIRNGGSEKPAYASLVTLLQRQGNTRALRDTLQQMHQRFPHDDTVLNDLTYLNLLLGENIPTSRQAARGLVERNPTLMACRVTAALSALRVYQTEEAYTYYASAQIKDLRVLQPSWQALYAAILGAQGKTSEARKIIKTLNTQTLLPEERALILPYQ
ncbi:MAG: hypothetical protein HC904_14000 [Blastochloris sp.]|nr:hypothetical protein [Blastochloris sp.]